MQQDENNIDIDISIAWVGVEDTPIVFANQFVIQHEPEEFILTVGQLAPPMLLGTNEQKAEQAKQLDYVPIKALARIGMSRKRMQELVAVLQGNLEQHDKRMDEMDPTKRA